MGLLNLGVSHVRPTLFLFLVSAPLGGCQVQDVSTSYGAVSPKTAIPSPPQDFGDISHFNACKAQPRRVLNEQEQCEIRLLFKNCTKAADCLVTCTMSPDGFRVGGGCYHICFSPMTQLEWPERPEIDVGECEKKLMPPLSG